MTNQRNKGRQKFRALENPIETPNYEDVQRTAWLEDVSNGFVSPSSANKRYYRAVLEALWPKGHGVPGPQIHREMIRRAIDDCRRANSKKPIESEYRDPFRRVRELQGEEGIKGIAIEGHIYQLVDLTVSEKRVPRTSLDTKSWEQVKQNYEETCPSCNKKEPEVRFQQDHKVPRLRGGGDEISNWMPLCDECNNFKSVACRACELDCSLCCWAYPEKYAPLHMKRELSEKLYSHAAKHKTRADDLLNNIVKNYLESFNE